MSAARRKPWMKFYPSDWQSDDALRSCSPASRGLWVEMLCVMHKAEPVGHLLVNGKPPSPRVLAVLCGTTPKEMQKALDELAGAGVFSLTDEGVIFSRRMVRDAAKAEEDKANGAKGGHPALRRGLTPPVIPPVDGGDKAQRLESRISPLPPSPGGERKSDRRKPKTAIPDGFPTAEAIAEQQQRARIDGADIDVAYQAERFRNWALGADARYADWNATWRNWVGKAIKEPPGLRFGGQPPARQAAPAPESETPELWRMRLRQWRADVPWNEVTWGPPPGQPRCRCPADLLSPSERRGDGPGSAP